ncbi:LysR family transcriptional regulator [Pseudomonas sp. R5(2019)]|uniref:LysR family transcriptional regulator n=1 Tax=Pseudomonas sp. R5(2019) TaxID=2697566 RepID=UPI001411BC90|nr:LysR family transcriptional regulator [Pseudomonas sp. R5(2019)]NBA96088.1 LysR family transcriptional regulator [Pseudomonas sp. R5(2019)]
MISLRHIEVFRAVMTTGSVTGAAQFLHTSQPTISRELARLEYLIGFELFKRERGRLHPTARAVMLFEEVGRAYTGLDRLVAFAGNLGDFAEGQFSIACLPAFSQSLLPSACQAFSQVNPNISIVVAAFDSPHLEEQLSAQRHDIGLTEQDEAPRGTELQPLLSVDEVCVLPDGHPLLAQERLSVEAFQDQAFVSLAADDSYRRQIDQIFRAAGVNRRMRIETHNAVSVCSMVQAGLGIAIINPVTALTFLNQGLQIRPLAFSLPFKVNRVQPLYRPATPLREVFLQVLNSEIAGIIKRLSALGVQAHIRNE